MSFQTETFIVILKVMDKLTIKQAITLFDYYHFLHDLKVPISLIRRIQSRNLMGFHASASSILCLQIKTWTYTINHYRFMM